MEKNKIISKLTQVFRKVFSDENLILTEDLTANDIENWDSLTHMVLISEVESEFNVKFKLKELNKMRNVGDLVNILLSK